MDQEGVRESFSERNGCFQLQGKRLATVFLPLCVQSARKVPDRWTISDKDLLHCPEFCLFD